MPPAGQNATSRTKLPAKITGWKATADFRLVVKSGVLTAFVNGQQVHEETLPQEADPWLAIESRSANQTGAVKSLRIIGSPEVPREISLSSGFTLDAWSPAYFAEKLAEEQDSTLGRRAAAPAASWRKQADEIIATKLPHCEGSWRESVLQYHRPLAEDGEIEYEFFYEPGKTEVHPDDWSDSGAASFQRRQVHRLTDAQYDRTGLLPDNVSPVANQQPVPLKAGEWNNLKLTISNGELKVAVNGSDIGRAKLPAGEQRTFGLFRYADQSAVRRAQHRAPRQLAHRTAAGGQTGTGRGQVINPCVFRLRNFNSHCFKSAGSGMRNRNGSPVIG